MRAALHFFLKSILFLALLDSALFANETPQSPQNQTTSVYVIPIEGQITASQLYILRRGLKEALQNEVPTIILKINTPGGALDTTLKMMEALENFKGATYAFVDKEAISAGSYIAAATNEIYLHPQGIIGAAAAIQATGQEIPETLKEKLNSYLRARVRSYTKEHRYRADVIRAMMDENFEFKIGEKVIKPKGELLTLTADEAIQKYGDPPESLLGSGIVKSVEELLDLKYGKGNYTIKDFHLTWSETLAKWLNSITPVLLGLGLLLLFIEFKTPGFGIFGISGILLLLVVFASSYVAGLAGYEAVIAFVAGLTFLAIEVLIFPGAIIFGILGAILLLGSIIWALSDIWPTKDFKFTPEVFVDPIIDLTIGLIIAIGGIILLGRFFLKSWLWNILILKTVVGKAPPEEARTTRREAGTSESAEPSDHGVAITDLHPSGEVEIKGRRYQAHAGTYSIKKGTNIIVVAKTGFALKVKEDKS